MPDRIDDNRAIERVLPPERTGLQTRTVAMFESGADLISGRELQSSREPLDARGERTLTNDYSQNYDENVLRYLPEARQPLAERDYNRILTTISGTVTAPSANNDATFQQALQNYFDPNSMGGSARNYDNGISVIPGGEIQSGNSNTLLIFLVIGIGALAGYWYYKKGGFNAV